MPNLKQVGLSFTNLHCPRRKRKVNADDVLIEFLWTYFQNYIIKMIEDIFYIVFLVLEVAVLSFFIYYMARYFSQYQEKVDPYTRATLILLVVSFIFQLIRLPLKVLEMISENDPDLNSSFNIWYEENHDNMKIVLKVIIFCHGNLQKTAILINIMRWLCLSINLDG